MSQEAAIKVRSGLRGSKSIIQNIGKDKEVKEVQVSRRFDLWIELDFDKQYCQVNFYQFKHYQMMTKQKSPKWEKIASKEMQ